MWFCFFAIVPVKTIFKGPGDMDLLIKILQLYVMQMYFKRICKKFQIIQPPPPLSTKNSISELFFQKSIIHTHVRIFLTSFLVGSVGFIRKNCFLIRHPETLHIQEVNNHLCCYSIIYKSIFCAFICDCTNNSTNANYLEIIVM